MTDDSDISAMATAIIPLVSAVLEDDEYRPHLKGYKGIFELTILQKGKKAGTWHILLNGDKEPSIIVEGKAPKKPTVSVTLEDETLLKLATGKLNPITTFMSGKIKIAGNLMMAQRMEVTFRNAGGYEKARPYILAFIEQNSYLKSKL